VFELVVTLPYASCIRETESTMVATNEYERINSIWVKAEKEGTIYLSDQELISAFRKLYLKAMKKGWKKKILMTSGNRHTWYNYSKCAYMINPKKNRGYKGLKELTHSVSHWCHYRKHPNDKPHSDNQFWLELMLTNYAYEKKWHLGTLKKRTSTN
tara:strand:+ start:248 stop:715 length:468 start_codon:yes stop_codon:yes gene_type:complete